VRAYLPFVVAGLASGSVYGLTALGLVLTYTTSGIFNFAHGAVAAAAAYGFYELHVVNGLPWPLAATICVFGLAPVVGLGLERLARDLAYASVAMKIVATIGLLLAIQGLLAARYGVGSIPVPVFLPDSVFEIAGTKVGVDQAIVMGIGVAGAAGLYALLRFTRLGASMRAVVGDPDLLDIAGTSPERIRRTAWMLGCAFAALSGILLAPALGLDVFLLTLLVVQAFGAAAIGWFSSLPRTYLGGLAVGVVAALATKYVASHQALAGLPASLPFLVLFLVLLLAPRHRLVEVRTVGGRTLDVGRALRTKPLAVATVILAALVVPHVVGTRLPVFMNALVFVIVFQSLRLVVHTSGQVSLCHAAFVAIGSAAFSHFVVGAGLPWLLALVLAALVTVPIGAVVAIPAIRLSGLFLALATLGFGILMKGLFYISPFMFGRQEGRRMARRPFLAVADIATDARFYYVLLAFVVLSTIVVLLIERSRLGRLLRALADSPTVLATNGADVSITLVLVFCISALLAGVAGALFAAMSGAASGASLGVFQSITWLTVLAISGRGALGPFVAALLLAVVPAYVENVTIVQYQPVFYGTVAVLAALASAGRLPSPMAAFRRAAERNAERIRRSPVAARRLRTNDPAGTVAT
jgi:branched-subunit amino acid ABC-type transport system permease component